MRRVRKLSVAATDASPSHASDPAQTRVYRRRLKRARNDSPMPTRERKTEILIVGGGTGGIAAAMAAASLGRSVIVTEETSWIGGQLTSQAVPPDENHWIEEFGCTRRYRTFRNGVRQYYREHYPLTAEARANGRLNPGTGFV